MSAAIEARFAAALRGLRLRVAAALLLEALPLAAGALLLAWRLGGAVAAAVVAAFALPAVALLLRRQLRRHDRRWYRRRLEDVLPELEDSADLLFGSTAIPAMRGRADSKIRFPLPLRERARERGAPAQPALRREGRTAARNDSTPLQQLQRQRLQTRLADRDWPDLRPPLRRGRLAAAWLPGFALLLLAWAAPALLDRLRGASQPAAAGSRDAQPAQLDAQVTITPPAYTGLPARKQRTLDLKPPAGSRLHWSLRAQPQPEAVALVFHDGSRLELERDGDSWQAGRQVEASTLYRLETRGAALAEAQRLYRLDVVADQPPEIVVRVPEKTLNLLAAGQQRWELAFEARDDYGLGAAELVLTRAQGSGEQVQVSEQVVALEGEGDARARRYAYTADLAALGFAEGDDLIARLRVFDRREPQAQRSESAGFILRWPPEASEESAGLEGLVQRTMPAYFRSQRQIIIDTEALIAQRAELDAEKLADRSDAIAQDQRILRLRYGQFLGEEDSGEHAQEHAGEAHEEAPPAGSDVLEEFGHTHDDAEAATLLDPETRRLLKSALDEMWQAEGQLRIAEPEAALPFEHKALEYVKQVQQASRIYLARSGLELPPVDPARRLSGERAGLGDRSAPAVAAPPQDSAFADAWLALADGREPEWAALEQRLREPAQAAENLDLLAALDRARREPQCAGCRAALQALLWPRLPARASGIVPRAAPDPAGEAYLRALAEPAP